LSASLLSHITRDAQEDEDVIFPRVLFRVESTKDEEANRVMKLLGKLK
jgi:hypothetical protein